MNDNRLSRKLTVILHACVAGSAARLKTAAGWHGRATAIAVLVSLQLFPAVDANPTGWQQALERGNFETALAQLKPLATDGDAAAQFVLGSLYYHGRGVSQDYGSAALWLGRAARQDHVQAQSMLGLMYARGLGVRRNFASAEELLTRAAERGDLEAQAGLGLLYSSTDLRHADRIRAHMWWSVAAERGYAHAGVSRERIGQSMTPAQIAVALSLARECIARNYRQCRYRPNDAEIERLQAEQDNASDDPDRLNRLRRQYKTAIMRKITKNWIRPDGSDDMPNCEVNVAQGPGGVVLNVTFESCEETSPEYRTSIEKAIYTSEPLPKPAVPVLFERDLLFIFIPR